MLIKSRIVIITLKQIYNLLIKIEFNLFHLYPHCLYYWFKWILYDRKNFIKILKEDLKLEKVKPLRISKWHESYSYYTAIKNGMKVFIKRGYKYNSIQREQTIQGLLEEKYKKFIPKMIACNPNNGINSYIVYQFINEMTLKTVLKNKLLTKEQKSILIHQLLKVLEILNKLKVIHMDINPSNIFVCMNSDIQLILFDFGFSIFKNDKKLSDFEDRKSTNELITLGAGYNPEPLYFDDAYSILLVMKEINYDLIKDNYDIWKSVNSYIGKLDFKLQ